MDIPLRLLIIEDSDRDVALEVRALEAAGYTVTYTVAETAAGMKAALVGQAFDIVISDHNLPQFDAPGALDVLKQSGQDIPFIIVSGAMGEEAAVALIKAGAHDYVMKDRLTRLGSAIEHAIKDSENLRERKLAEEKLLKSYESVKKTLNDTINTMVKIVEIRDPYTAGHQQKVADLAIAIGSEMKLEATRIDQLRTAALIHDIGKIYTPSDILSKPGKLADIEFGLIKTHAQNSYDIVKGMNFPGVVAEAILQHHERLDGSGYPNGLKGKDTLIEAKILVVADVIEAMASDRPYRPALGIDKALEEISKNKGKLYDPAVVDICVELFKSGKFKFKPV